MAIEQHRNEQFLWQVRLDELVGGGNHKRIDVPYARVDIQRGLRDYKADWTVRISGLQSGLLEVVYGLNELKGLVFVRGVNSLPYHIPGLEAGFFNRFDPSGGYQTFEVTDESVPPQLEDKFRGQADKIVKYIEDANRNATLNNVGGKES